MKTFLIKNRNINILIFIFIAFNILILLNRGIFWDDWTLYHNSFQAIKDTFIENGGWYFGWGYLHYFLLSSAPEMTYRLIIFVLGLFTTLFFYIILGKFNILSNSDRLIISIIIISLPIYQAKLTMICLPYTFILFMFTSGYLLLLNNLKNNKWYIRAIICIIVFYSFGVNSFLLLYLIFPFTILYYHKTYNLKKFIAILIRYIDFLLLPVAFLILRYTLLKPTGLHAAEGYNTFSLHYIIILPMSFVRMIYYSFLLPFFNLFINIKIWLLLIALPILFIFMKSKFEFGNKLILKNKFLLLFIGIVLFILGVLPYLLVGKIPVYNYYENRHQLLMGFGVSIIVFSVINFIKNKRLKLSLLYLLITVNLLLTLKLQVLALKTWFKYDAIIYNFRRNEQFKQIKFGLIKDNTFEYNIRFTSFYEWNGMSKLATNRQDKLLYYYERYEHDIKNQYITIDDFRNVMNNFKKHEQYNMKDFNSQYFPGEIKIQKGKFELNTKNTFRLLIIYYFNKSYYYEKIKDILEMDCYENSNSTNQIMYK